MIYGLSINIRQSIAIYQSCCNRKSLLSPFTSQISRVSTLGLLAGGGFALAVASRETGLNIMISKAMQVLIGLPNIVVQSITFVLANFFSAFNANVVVANIVLPILCEMVRCL